MELSEIINYGIGGGGMLALLTLITKHFLDKKKNAVENEKRELENEITLAHEWKGIAEEREEKLNKKEEKIEALHAEINTWRDRNNVLLKEINKKDIELTNMFIKTCNKRGCEGREPQTGY